MTDELKMHIREKRSLTQGFENAYLGTNPFLYSTYSHLGDYYYQMEEL